MHTFVYLPTGNPGVQACHNRHGLARLGKSQRQCEIFFSSLGPFLGGGSNMPWLPWLPYPGWPWLALVGPDLRRPALGSSNLSGLEVGMAAMGPWAASRREKEKKSSRPPISCGAGHCTTCTTACLWGPKLAPKLRESLFVRFSGDGGPLPTLPGTAWLLCRTIAPALIGSITTLHADPSRMIQVVIGR